MESFLSFGSYSFDYGGSDANKNSYLRMTCFSENWVVSYSGSTDMLWMNVHVRFFADRPI